MQSTDKFVFDLSARIRSKIGSGKAVEKIASATGLSPATIYRIRAGAVLSLTVVDAVRLADALKVSRVWLLTGEGQP